MVLSKAQHRFISQNKAIRRILSDQYNVLLARGDLGELEARRMHVKSIGELMNIREVLNEQIRKAFEAGMTANEISGIAGSCRGNLFDFSGALGEKVARIELEKILGKTGAPKDRENTLLTDCLEEIEHAEKINPQDIIQLKKLIRINGNDQKYARKAIEHMLCFSLSKRGFSGRISAEGLKGETGLGKHMWGAIDEVLESLVKRKIIIKYRKGASQPMDMYTLANRTLIQKYSTKPSRK